MQDQQSQQIQALEQQAKEMSYELYQAQQNVKGLNAVVTQIAQVLELTQEDNVTFNTLVEKVSELKAAADAAPKGKK